jgi:hypothetical protein
MNSFPLPSIFRFWVSRVGMQSDFEVFLRVDAQSSCATHSAVGATARAHVGAVSESLVVIDAINLQLPFRSSRNHSRLNG